MKSSKPYPKPIFFAIVVIILATLACGIMSRDTNDEGATMQQTLDAMLVTQSALQTQVAEEPVQPTVEIPTVEPVQPTEEIIPEEPSPTETEPVEVSDTPDVLYEGISFSFSPDVAQSAFAETIPGENLGPDTMPGMNYPTHFKFTLNGYPVDNHNLTPKILVYPVDDYRTICSQAADTIDNLDRFLRTQSSDGFNNDLPFLPIWPAAQLFDAAIEFIDFQNGSGVRFLTMYGQDIYPIDNQNLFYTYQGLTDDGRYYISAILPVTHAGFPEDGFETVDDWQAFRADWEFYLWDKTTLFELQLLLSDPFTPNLRALDALIASIQVDR